MGVVMNEQMETLWRASGGGLIWGDNETNEYAHPSLEDLRIGPELQPNQEEHLRVCDAAILRFWARDARTHKPAPPFDQKRA